MREAAAKLEAILFCSYVNYDESKSPPNMAKQWNEVGILKNYVGSLKTRLRALRRSQPCFQAFLDSFVR
jgi:hypothetical protein